MFRPYRRRWFAISLFFITSSATADPDKWCAAYGLRAGRTVGSDYRTMPRNAQRKWRFLRAKPVLHRA